MKRKKGKNITILKKATVFFMIMAVMGFTLGNTGSSSINDVSRKSYRIQWVGMYPSGDNAGSGGFKNNISGVILGKKKTGLMKPFGVYVEDSVNFWVLDQGIGTIIHVFHNKSSVPYALKKQNRSYPSLAGICANGDHELLFTDSRLNKVFVLSSDRKKIRSLNDSLSLEQPTGIAWSPSGNEIWVVETKAHRISVLDSKGRLIKRIGRRGNGPGQFNYPTFIWIDTKGNVYIVDSMNFRLQILDSDGTFITAFGKIGDASGYFSRPKGVAVDSHGNIYIADALYNVVQIYDKEGRFLYYFGSQGHKQGQFWMPGGIFIDKNDFIYVADTYNARVQIFQLKED